MNRREFMGKAAATTALSMVAPMASFSKQRESQLKLAFIGVGARGAGQLSVALQRKDVVITAVCDIDRDALTNAQELVKKAGQKTPVAYGKGELDYKNLLEKEDVDGVIISTPWTWHTKMAVDAMKAGKATGLEVAGAFSIEECWDLVEAYESTNTPFMILENVCYRRDVMAVLGMVRENLFGEIVHLQGGYEHDLRAVKFNNGKQLYGGGVEFGDKGYSEAKWRTQHSVSRNGELYPTHGLGPAGLYINNNRGNRFVSLTSTASKARGLHDYIVNHPNGGANHPNANIEFKLGDIVNTMIKCANGESIMLTHDTSLPRPYSLGFRVQGTKGLWMDINNSIHIEGKSRPHEWENADNYMKKYDHPLWKKHENDTQGAGHGGMDFFVLHAFVEALKQGKEMPLDVYDCVSWSSVTCLSEQSIARGSEPQEFPDFTNGKWVHRKPIFGFDDAF
ncbi:Oxidoreductase family, NAD-binding Rossmann fold [Reichenbachiella faecimaris]|uniref:Oxidoreductase family, NAD-binding Rossmann fold n=1 Tax=Reichenbachiella faecimaris TaxID=692418 RepID=A0A1W2G8S5_REIFA|nr:Gfo/Idh/MocA family oxidoreductase [Reichenbachiella faecimaris]SMD32842.1 Oxidoreductase family, NAD-binding Rossmann fold [Reichenbachiella faecimaris]